MILVKIILMLALVYGLLGLLFAIFFLARGMEKIDTSAHGSGLGFRLIILPGTIALWPVLLSKWMKEKKTDHDQATS
jgi:hypothetical protein